jgi:hypothetical protein
MQYEIKETSVCYYTTTAERVTDEMENSVEGESTTKTTTDWIFRICRYYDPRADISMK